MCQHHNIKFKGKPQTKNNKHIMDSMHGESCTGFHQNTNGGFLSLNGNKKKLILTFYKNYYYSLNLKGKYIFLRTENIPFMLEKKYIYF